MSSKDEILTAIRQNTVQRYEYPDWEIKATVYPDKISRFCEISQFVGGKAVVLQEAEDINDIIRSHFPEARKIASQMEEITCATIRPDTLAEAQELDGTDVAVVEGAFGVAENGAVWIPQNVKHKALYFIAEALVIVLDRHSLVHNMQEAYELLRPFQNSRYRTGIGHGGTRGMHMFGHFKVIPRNRGKRISHLPLF